MTKGSKKNYSKDEIIDLVVSNDSLDKVPCRSFEELVGKIGKKDKLIETFKSKFGEFFFENPSLKLKI